MRKPSPGQRYQREPDKAGEGPPLESAPAGWLRFGWQGISGLVPPEWNLGAIGGDYKRGYLRLDDLEHPRLEVKWSRQAVDLFRVREKYLRALARPRGKIPGLGRRGAEVNREARIVSNRAKPSKRVLGFSWQDGKGFKGAGLVWDCRVCGRTLFGQVRGYGEEEAVGLARKVFASLEDHGEEGRLLWALYGMECLVPESYLLTGQSLMAGYLELDFQEGGRSLRVSRWGLAANLLAEQSLKEWFETTAAGSRSEFLWEARDTIVKGHTGLETEGETRRPAARLAKGLCGLLPWRKAGPAPDAAGRVWHCPESNRIYLVEGLHRPEAETVEEVVSSLRCH